ncbi:MAG: glycoside hydrolase family 88 protein [Prolixibacteraceae bacterium]
MKRRAFIQKAPIAGMALGTTASLLAACTTTKKEGLSFSQKTILEKVKTAMLSMQRATWEQGVAMQAMLESGEKELVILMAKDAVLRQTADGRVAMCGEDGALTDAASPGEAIIWAAHQTGDEKLLEGQQKLLKYMMVDAPRNSEGIIYHFTNTPQFWSDCNYMLPPYLAVSGEYTECLKQIYGVKGYLWNEEKQLFSHMWHDGDKRFARKDFWGVGNGWSAAGFTRVIAALPDSMVKEKQDLIDFTIQLIDGCLVHQRPDGFFYDVLDKPETFIETNLGQQLAYTIYKGVNAGWLKSEYLESAHKMRAAAHSKVDEYGLVQGVCGSPNFNAPGTATEGQVFFILMEVAYQQLSNHSKSNT